MPVDVAERILMHPMSARILVLTLMVTGVSACTVKGESQSTRPDSAMEKAAKAPLVDLNLLRAKIPDVLRTARQSPYGFPDDHDCGALGAEIRELDRSLGADLDRRPGSHAASLFDQGAAEAGDAAADALKDLATGWIPYRGWVRRLSGAERHSRALAKYIAAGMTRRAWLKGLGQAAGCVPPAAPAAPYQTVARWRLVITRLAPWAHSSNGTDLRLLGQTLQLDRDALTGPPPLNCAHADIETVPVPAEGLFEGGLPAPAEAQAHRLGFTRLPVETLRLTCANAVFDLHRVDGDTLLLALDNQIWTLSSTPGTDQVATAPAEPAARVQRFLEAHFSGSMTFDPAGLERIRSDLSPALVTALDRYFAASDLPADEPPFLSGDPFTDTQDYPTRFAVEAARVDGDLATVAVRFADGYRQHRVHYRLARGADGWRIDDIVARNGARLAEDLANLTNGR